MQHLVDRFKYLLMDDEAAVAARLLGAGATYWRTADGGMTVVRDAILIKLGKRQAGQVKSLLKIEVSDASRVARRAEIAPHLARLLTNGEFRSFDCAAAA